MKIFFIGPGFWVEVTEVIDQNLVYATLIVKGVRLAGSIKFDVIQEEWRPEHKHPGPQPHVTPVLGIIQVDGPCVGIAQLSDITSEILQQYKAFAHVVGNAWLDGFFKTA